MFPDLHEYLFAFTGLKRKIFGAGEDTMPPTTTADDLTEALNVVQQNVSTNAIMVFSKSYCPFCNKVKNLFEERGLAYKALELDQMGQLGENIQATLLQKTGQKTVPSVFVDGNHIGKKTLKAFLMAIVCIQY